VDDNITIGSSGTVNDSALSSSVSLLGQNIEDGEVDNNITIGSSGSVDDGALSSSVSLLGQTISSSEITGGTLITETEGIGSNDNDSSLPTAAAVKDYADSNDSDTTYSAGGNLMDLSGTTFSVTGTETDFENDLFNVVTPSENNDSADNLSNDNLSALANVAASGATNGELLGWNGSNWVNVSDSNTQNSENDVESFIFDADNTGTLSSGTLDFSSLSYTGTLSESEIDESSLDTSDFNNDAGFISDPNDTVSGSELDNLFGSSGFVKRTGNNTYGTISSLSDSEIDNNITIGSSGSVNDSALSSSVSLLGQNIEDGEVDDNITISANGSVADGALSSSVSLLGQSIGSSEIAGGTLITETEGIGSNDNDSSLPTAAAVKDYADSNDSDTTYSAGGNLMNLSGTTFSVTGTETDFENDLFNVVTPSENNDSADNLSNDNIDALSDVNSLTNGTVLTRESGSVVSSSTLQDSVVEQHHHRLIRFGKRLSTFQFSIPLRPEYRGWGGGQQYHDQFQRIGR
jgi:hypothetical protein